MEASRIGIEKSAKLSPKIYLSSETFDFVKDMKVGETGQMKFSGIVKSHVAKQSESDEETKTVKFTNLMPLRKAV